MKLNEFKQKYSENPGFNNILDFLIKNGYENKEIMFNFEQAKLKEKEWIKSLNKNKNKAQDGSTKTIKKFANGFTIVKLIDQQSRDYEGANMNHCVASYTDSAILYSLRDKENKPHCTIEISDDMISQIKGFGNGKISPKYVSYVLSFLKTLKLDIDSTDMENLGYHLLTNELSHSIKKQLSNYKILKFNNTNYIYTGNKLLLIKKIEAFDLTLFSYLCSYDQCRECFEQLIKHKQNDLYNEFNLAASLLADAAIAGNIFALNLLYNKYKNSINIDLFDLIRDCIDEDKPASVVFLLKKIPKNEKIDYDVLLHEAIQSGCNRIMFQSIAVKMNKVQTQQFYQEALQVELENEYTNISLINWLITAGAKVNKKLPYHIMYNDNYKQLLDILSKNGADLSIKSNKILILKTGFSFSDKSMIDLSIDLGLTLSRKEAYKLYPDIPSYNSKLSQLIEYYLESKVRKQKNKTQLKCFSNIIINK